jgi:O-antigen/teichoic acid export membrane protein
VYLLDIGTSLGGMSESNPAASGPSSSAGKPVDKSDAKPEKVMPRGSSTSLLFTIAVVLSSVVFALPVTVAKITEGILDSTNPDGIKDTGAGLSDHYIGPILGWGFGSLAVLLLIVIVVFALIYRRERTLDALKLPLMIVAIQILLGVFSIIFNAVAIGGR